MRIAAITREPSPGQPRPRSRDAGPRALGRSPEDREPMVGPRDGAPAGGVFLRRGSPKSSLLYLLRPMARLGYLVSSADGRYQLGPAAFTLAMAALSNRELPQLARPFLEDLAEKSGETALLATMASDEPVAVYIDKVDGRDPIRYTPPLGLRRPLYCSAIGKLLLAHLPPTRRQEYLRTTRLRAFTAQTPVTRSALRRAIEEIRAAGVSISMDEIAEGAAGIAAPVFDRRGDLLARLVVGGPSKRLPAAPERLGAPVVARARALSRVMGFGAEPAS